MYFFYNMKEYLGKCLVLQQTFNHLLVTDRKIPLEH